MPDQPLLPFGEPLPAEAPSPRPGKTRRPALARTPAPAAPTASPLAAPATETSRLIEEFVRICREHPLEEKVLVAPSLAIGHTLVERLAREGHPR